MDIIKVGLLPSEQRYRKTCTHCGTVFEFARGETQHTDSRDQRDAGTLWVNCPLRGCGLRQVVRRDEQVPQRYQAPSSWMGQQDR